MKLTEQHKVILEALKGKLLLNVRAHCEPFRVENVEVYGLCGWKTEEIPYKKGFFGHDAYTKLTELYVKTIRNINTNYVGVQDSNLRAFIAKMERDRGLFISLTEELGLFGFKFEKHEQDKTQNQKGNL